jgi:predicted NUDIX family phosphoesterase
MKSDKWDEKEKEPFNGFMKRDKAEHEHIFDGITGKCIYCFKTREDLRKEW